MLEFDGRFLLKECTCLIHLLHFHSNMKICLFVDVQHLKPYQGTFLASFIILVYCSSHKSSLAFESLGEEVIGLFSLLFHLEYLFCNSDFDLRLFMYVCIGILGTVKPVNSYSMLTCEMLFIYMISGFY